VIGSAGARNDERNANLANEHGGRMDTVNRLSEHARMATLARGAIATIEVLDLVRRDPTQQLTDHHRDALRSAAELIRAILDARKNIDKNRIHGTWTNLAPVFRSSQRAVTSLSASPELPEEADLDRLLSPLATNVDKLQAGAQVQPDDIDVLRSFFSNVGDAVLESLAVRQENAPWRRP